MNKTILMTAFLAGTLLASGTVQASKVMSVAYGTITGVNQQERDTSGGKTGGAP